MEGKAGDKASLRGTIGGHPDVPRSREVGKSDVDTGKAVHCKERGLEEVPAAGENGMAPRDCGQDAVGLGGTEQHRKEVLSNEDSHTAVQPPLGLAGTCSDRRTSWEV